MPCTLVLFELRESCEAAKVLHYQTRNLPCTLAGLWRLLPLTRRSGEKQEKFWL